MRRVAVLAALAGALACATPTPAPPASRPSAALESAARDEHALSAEAVRAVLEAELQLEEGNVDGGVQLLQEAVLHDPRSPYLHARLAEVWLEAGDAAQARAQAEAALALDARHVPALRALGRAQALAGEGARARRSFARALEVAPGDRDASRLLAESLLDAGDVAGAEGVVEALMRAQPGDIDGYVGLARLFAERGEADRAFAHVDKALEREANDADALGLKLAMLWAQGRFDAAVPVARALAADGQEPVARRDLLTALALGGARADASAFASTWLDDDPSDAARLLVAEGWERAGEPAAALRVLEGARALRMVAEAARIDLSRGKDHGRAAAARVCPALGEPSAGGRARAGAGAALADDADLAAFAWSTCARALAAAGDAQAAAKLLARLRAEPPPWGEQAPVYLDALAAVVHEQPANAPERGAALELADRALAAAPTAADVIGAVARIHEQLDDIDGARRILDDALRARPTDADLAFALARHLERRGQVAAAVDIVERLLERGREGVDELNFVAFSLAEQGVRADDARRLAWRALLRDPLNGYVVDTLGWAQLAGGDVDGALLTLQRADRLSPGEGEILFHLASALAKKGARKEAAATARRALDVLAADDPVRARAAAMVQALGS